MRIAERWRQAAPLRVPLATAPPAGAVLGALAGLSFLITWQVAATGAVVGVIVAAVAAVGAIIGVLATDPGPEPPWLRIGAGATASVGVVGLVTALITEAGTPFLAFFVTVVVVVAVVAGGAAIAVTLLVLRGSRLLPPRHSRRARRARSRA